MFQALLCFDLVSPFFNFCLTFARMKLQHLYVDTFMSAVVGEAFYRSIPFYAAHELFPFFTDDMFY